VAKLDANGIPVYTINKPNSTVSATNLDRSCTYLGTTFRCFSTHSANYRQILMNPIIITLTARATSTGTKINEAFLRSETSDTVTNNNCDVNTLLDTAITNCDKEVIQVGSQVTGIPNITLLKRITGVYRRNTPVVTNPNQLFSQFNNGATIADDPANWLINKWPSLDADGNVVDPNTQPEKNVYLRGAIDGGEVQSDDEIEFTIYFVNNGNANATNVILCDLVPRNLDFVQNAYGNGKGIAVSFDDENRDSNPDNNELYLEPNSFYSNANDTDEGTFFAPGLDTIGATPKCSFNSVQNTDGVIAVDLGTVPNATAQGDPTNSYGFIRFRAKVK
jgi:serine-aspartate repeat-containing protein C/D/E